jgi:uncharacterized membrane protein YphA (DoxX/SURF4 family)
MGLQSARVPQGEMYALSGYSKYTGGGVSAFVAGSRGYVPHYMPSWFGPLFLNALPYVELLVGAMLVLGILGRLGGFLASLLLTSFLLAFHTLLDPRSPTPMPNTNTVLLGIALLVFLAGPGQFSLDRATWKKKGNGGGSGGDA